LHHNIAIGEAHDKTVFGGIVLVLGLGDKTLASVVIGLSNTTALVLCLVATATGQRSSRAEDGSRYSPVVRTVLDQLGERLAEIHESAICASDPIPKQLA
jgi:hypothetical protein